MMNGLTNVNVELTSRCNKSCWMCGRRKMEREHPEIVQDFGDMDLVTARSIARQLPSGIVVQLHNNGEPLMYPFFGMVLKLFERQITNIVTNGKLLEEKAYQLIGHLDTLAISIIEKEEKEEAAKQRMVIKRFLKIKGNRKPFTVLRLVGKVDERKYVKLKIPIIRRNLHAPMGSFNYEKPPTIPEIGICLDMLNHLAIDRHGNVSICVRFDPEGLGVLGNLGKQTLEEIWNGSKRLEWRAFHKYGRRDKVPLCSKCEYWGVPTGG